MECACCKRDRKVASNSISVLKMHNIFLLVDEGIKGLIVSCRPAHLRILVSDVGRKVGKEVIKKTEGRDVTKDSRSSEAATIESSTDGREEGIGSSKVEAGNGGVRGGRPLMINVCKHLWNALRAIATPMP